jgi:hypothetical protein
MLLAILVKANELSQAVSRKEKETKKKLALGRKFEGGVSFTQLARLELLEGSTRTQCAQTKGFLGGRVLDRSKNEGLNKRVRFKDVRKADSEGS